MEIAEHDAAGRVGVTLAEALSGRRFAGPADVSACLPARLPSADLLPDDLVDLSVVDDDFDDVFFGSLLVAFGLLILLLLLLLLLVVLWPLVRLFDFCSLPADRFPLDGLGGFADILLLLLTFLSLASGFGTGAVTSFGGWLSTLRMVIIICGPVSLLFGLSAVAAVEIVAATEFDVAMALGSAVSPVVDDDDMLAIGAAIVADRFSDSIQLYR